jgi:hypothetical protein
VYVTTAAADDAQLGKILFEEVVGEAVAWPSESDMRSQQNGNLLDMQKDIDAHVELEQAKQAELDNDSQEPLPIEDAPHGNNEGEQEPLLKKAKLEEPASPAAVFPLVFPNPFRVPASAHTAGAQEEQQADKCNIKENQVAQEFLKEEASDLIQVSQIPSIHIIKDIKTKGIAAKKLPVNITEEGIRSFYRRLVGKQAKP